MTRWYVPDLVANQDEVATGEEADVPDVFPRVYGPVSFARVDVQQFDSIHFEIVPIEH